MRLIGIILLSALALNLAARAAAIALLVLLLIAFVSSPRATLGTLITLFVMGLAAQYPIVMIPALIGLAVLGRCCQANANLSRLATIRRIEGRE